MSLPFSKVTVKSIFESTSVFEFVVQREPFRSNLLTCHCFFCRELVPVKTTETVAWLKSSKRSQTVKCDPQKTYILAPTVSSRAVHSLIPLPYRKFYQYRSRHETKPSRPGDIATKHLTVVCSCGWRTWRWCV